MSDDELKLLEDYRSMISANKKTLLIIAHTTKKAEDNLRKDMEYSLADGYPAQAQTAQAGQAAVG